MRELTEAEIAILRDPPPNYALHIDVYHEDMGNVLWWVKPGHVMPDGWGTGHGEPPWVGKPGDSDWAGYHEWFTFLPPYPTEWMAPPSPPAPPPEFEVDIALQSSAVVITHAASRLWRDIEIKPGRTLAEYEAQALFAKRRLREIVAMKTDRGTL